MPRESLERLREALTRLPTASRADLRTEWLRLYRTEAPGQGVAARGTIITEELNSCSSPSSEDLRV